MVISKTSRMGNSVRDEHETFVQFNLIYRKSDLFSLTIGTAWNWWKKVTGTLCFGLDVPVGNFGLALKMFRLFW